MNKYLNAHFVRYYCLRSVYWVCYCLCNMTQFQPCLNQIPAGGRNWDKSGWNWVKHIPYRGTYCFRPNFLIRAPTLARPSMIHTIYKFIYRPNGNCINLQDGYSKKSQRLNVFSFRKSESRQSSWKTYEVETMIFCIIQLLLQKLASVQKLQTSILY